MEIIRSLVTRIDVLPQQARGQVEPNVRGALAELLNLPNRQPSEPPSAGMVVAEERYRLSAKYTLLPSFLRLR